MLGEVAAEIDALARIERHATAAAWRAERDALQAADEPLALFDGAVEHLSHTALRAAGYRQHHRGEWRRRRQTMNEREQADSAVAVPRDARVLAEQMEKAAAGDEEELALVTQVLDGIPGGWRAVADVGLQAERLWIGLVAGDDPLMRAAIGRRLTALREDLADPTSSPLEKLLVDRVVACWLALQHADEATARLFENGGTLAQARFHQDRLDRAQRRFLSAVRNLAQVRRLLGPTVQVNIADQQVNIAGS